MQMSEDENNIITNLEYSLGNEKNCLNIMNVLSNQCNGSGRTVYTYF